MRTKVKFCTAINCIDGRAQLPFIKWMKKKFSCDFVDMITEPGVDKIFSQESRKGIETLKSKVLISVKAHSSKVVAIAAHSGCAGNPVSKKEHLKCLRKAIQVMRGWNLPVKIVSLWINDKFNVQEVK